MEPVALYKSFSQEFFYNFHKHSTDLELEELGSKYAAWLDKQGPAVNAILQGEQPPGALPLEARKDLEYLALMEAKFAKALPLEIRAERFESETGFSRIQGTLRRLVDGQAHLVRLVNPSEYDKNYWFYASSDGPPQHVFCREFGLDLIEYLKGVSTVNRAKLRNLRRALAFRQQEVYQFWTLAPYLHHALMKLGYPWDRSIMTLLRLAGRRYSQEGQPFAGSVRFQLGYDERMPTHLIARMEVMRDIACLKSGLYQAQYHIAPPDTDAT